jgi:hypothetical protein
MQIVAFQRAGLVVPKAIFSKRNLASKSNKPAGKSREQKPAEVDYGSDWFTSTRENSRRFKTVREEMGEWRGEVPDVSSECHRQCLHSLQDATHIFDFAEWRRQANLKANNGKERKDLYTENWNGVFLWMEQLPGHALQQPSLPTGPPVIWFYCCK